MFMIGQLTFFLENGASTRRPNFPGEDVELLSVGDRIYPSV
jgi:hypothetical protein